MIYIKSILRRYFPPFPGNFPLISHLRREIFALVGEKFLLLDNLLILLLINIIQESISRYFRGFFANVAR